MNAGRESRFERTELLYGKAAVSALANMRVAVFGIGGVGGYVVEALARSGIGALDLVDHDRVTITNLNRQIIATEATIGEYKVDAAKERVLSINPACRVTAHRLFYLPETAGEIDLSAFDYVVDAVDNVTAKLLLAEGCRDAGVPLISAMGTGNKTDPSRLKVTDLFSTSVCPLARVMRRECRKRGITALKVVYSEEEPGRHRDAAEDAEAKPAPETEVSAGAWERQTPGTNAMVPACAGLLLAAEVIKDLTEKYR